MKKCFGLLLVFALAFMLMGSASMALADDTNLTGDWSGTWTCPGGEKTEGALEGHIDQTAGNPSLSGQFTMKGTIIGDKTGKFSGSALDGNMSGDITGDIYVEMTGKYTNDSITGTYHSDAGDGDFTLNRH